MARPRKISGDRLDQKIHFAVSKQQYLDAHAKAEADSLKLSEYARGQVINGVVAVQEFGIPDPDTVYQLRRLAVNLHQFLRLAEDLAAVPDELANLSKLVSDFVLRIIEHDPRRPRKGTGEPLTERIHFAVSKQQRLGIEAKAKSFRLSLSDYARQHVLNGCITAYRTRTLAPEAFQYLRDMGISLDNALHRAYITEKIPATLPDLCKVIEAVLRQEVIKDGA